MKTVFAGFLLSSFAALAAAGETLPAAKLESLLSQPIDEAAQLDPLFADVMVREGRIDGAILQLERYARDERHPRAHRTRALLAGSHLQWRTGNLAAARASLEAASKLGPDALVAEQMARALEAGSEPARAREWYGKALELSADPTRKAMLSLRLTFLADQGAQSLPALARTRDAQFRNRAAIALALRGDCAQAMKLYEITGDRVARFRQHLRRAQWALQAESFPDAQKDAWQAVQLANDTGDRRYSLSVLVESHERDNSLDSLLRQLSAKPALNADEQTVRVDLLRRLGRYDEAIALFRQADAGLSMESRRQLLRMYGEAGREKDMAAEYQRLMEAEPDEVSWPEGLSQHLIEQGDSGAAQQMWERYIARTERPAVLLAAGAALQRFGFDALAQAAAEKSAGMEGGDAFEARMFQFELAARQGVTERAQEVLASLDRALAPGDAHRIELSQAYERIKQPRQALAVLEAVAGAIGDRLDIDARMRLAWLYDSTGRRDKALAMWKALWMGRFPDVSRRLIEDRLLALAAETGGLGDLAVELETKLGDGAADRRDAALLIRIYTEANDPAAAVEIIEEYFGAGGGHRADLSSLREQARVYLALGEGDAYRSVLQELLRLDPSNKAEYLQGLVLNRIESAEAARQDADGSQLRRWLAQLRSAGGGGEEFEAGVLALAGLNDDAIEVYQRTLALKPTQGDNYLLLVDLLGKKARAAEGVALLQYLVERAEKDDAFVIGIDGILNLKPRDPEIYRWAQRRVFERLTASGDRPYLYDLLAELAEESGDGALYFAALENSLAYADSRRSHVLRELVVASGEQSGNRLRQPDAARTLRYSQRLIALGEELPPEIYMNLGKTFLKTGDADNAARAFRLAVDRTGDFSLLEDIGNLFRDSGFYEQAVAQYEAALIGDADNAAIMSKLAGVRSAQGRTAQAHGLYLKAMLRVLNSQPSRIEVAARQGAEPKLADTVTYAYRDTYKSLLAGFLATLPEDGAASFAAIESEFDRALAQASSAPNAGPEVIAAYPRLNTLSLFVRAVAMRTGRYALEARIDARLLRRFATDEALAATIAGQRLAWGLALADGSTARRIHEQVVAQALLDADQDRALAAYREWFVAVAPPGALPEERRGAWRSSADVVVHAQGRLDAKHFDGFCRFIHDAVRANPDYATDLLFGTGVGFVDPKAADSILLSIEQRVGRPMLTAAQVRKLAARGPSVPSQAVDADYVTRRLTLDEQLEEFRRLVAAEQDRFINWVPALKTLRILLSRPLTPAAAARIDRILKERVQQVAQDRRYELASFVSQLLQSRLTSGIDPANAALVESLDSYFAAAYPEDFPAGALRAGLLRDLGRETEALPFIVDIALLRYEKPQAGGALSSAVAADGSQPDPDETGRGAMLGYLAPIVKTLDSRQRVQLLELAARKEQTTGLTPALLALNELLRTLDPLQDPLETLAWLERSAQRYPGNDRLLGRLQAAYVRLGFPDRERELRQRRGQETTSLAAQAQGLSQDMPASVAANVAPPGVVAVGVSGGVGGGRSTPGGEDFGIIGTPAAQAALKRLFALKEGEDEIDARAALREIWRMSLMWTMDLTPPSIQFAWDPANGQMQYEWLMGLKWGGEDFFTRLARCEFAVDELQAQVNALSPSAIDDYQPVYAALADAYERRGTLQERLRALAEDFEAGRAGTKELMAWMEMLSRVSPEQAREYLPLAERWVAQAAQSGYPWMLLARLHAAAGNPARAADDYNQALVARITPLRYSNGQSSLFTAAGLYTEAAGHLDAAAMDRFLTGVMRLTAPDGSALKREGHARLLMKLLEQNADLPVARAAFLASGGPAAGQSDAAADRFRAVAVYARLGERDEALRLLQTTLARSGEDPPSGPSAGFSVQSDSSWMQAEQYSMMLGADERRRWDAGTVDPLQRLFAVDATAWPQERDWVTRAAQAIGQWTEEGIVSRARGLQAMSQAIIRLNRLGATDTAHTLAVRLQKLMPDAASIPAPVAKLVVQAMRESGHPLDESILRDLSSRWRIPAPG